MKNLRSLIQFSMPVVGIACLLGFWQLQTIHNPESSRSKALAANLFDAHAIDSPAPNLLGSESNAISTTSATSDQQDEEPDDGQPESPTISPPLGSTAILLQVEGELEDGDLMLPSDRSLYDEHAFEGRAGQPVIITLESDDFDTYLILVSPDQQLLNENDDVSEQNTNSSMTAILPTTGTYLAVANAFDSGGQGTYTLTVREIVRSSNMPELAPNLVEPKR